MKNPLKIMLIGYGKMGKEIEKILLSRNHKIAAVIENTEAINRYSSLDVDMAIDFTQPDAALSNIKACAQVKIPVVVGTTGWYSQLAEAELIIKQNQSALFYASNFSIGVHLFFKVNQYLSSIISPHQYSASVVETHHTQKKDAPSGTAITTLEQVIAAHERYNQWQLIEESVSAPDKNTIPVSALRINDVPGTHEVTWDSEVDQIQVIHTAKNRKGFALGAVIAAEWLCGKQGVYTMDHMMQSVI